jgi:hypothetical protein
MCWKENYKSTHSFKSAFLPDPGEIERSSACLKQAKQASEKIKQFLAGCEELQSITHSTLGSGYTLKSELMKGKKGVNVGCHKI